MKLRGGVLSGTTSPSLLPDQRSPAHPAVNNVGVHEYCSCTHLLLGLGMHMLSEVFWCNFGSTGGKRGRRALHPAVSNVG